MMKIPQSQKIDLEVPIKPIKPRKPRSPSIFKRLFEIGKTIYYSIRSSIEVFRGRYRPLDLESMEQRETRTQFEILKDMVFEIDQLMHNTQYKIQYYDYLSAKERYKLDYKKYELQIRKLQIQVKSLPRANTSRCIDNYADGRSEEKGSLDTKVGIATENSEQLPPYDG